MDRDMALERVKKSAAYGDSRRWVEIVTDLCWIWQEYALADDSSLTKDAQEFKQALLTLFPQAKP